MPAFDRPARRAAWGRLLQSSRFDLRGVKMQLARIAGRPACIYRPKSRAADIPLVYFHGGGFVMGGLETHERLCQRLCAHLELPIVAVEYGLAPDHRAPAQLENAVKSVAAVLAGEADLGFEPQRIGIGGDSAGGYLAARAALDLPPDQKARLAGLLLLYPLLQLDFSSWLSSAFSKSRFAGLPAIGIMRGYGLDRHFKPLTSFDLTGLPPVTIGAGDWLDPTSADLPEFVDALEAADIAVTTEIRRGLVHGELCFPDRSRQADDLLKAAARSFTAAL